jgi:hypothetical protein
LIICLWLQTSCSSGADYDLFVGWGINPFGGEVREFRVWDRARTQVEIQRDLNSVLNGSESGLLAYWRGESGSGGWLNAPADDFNPNTAQTSHAVRTEN